MCWKSYNPGIILIFNYNNIIKINSFLDDFTGRLQLQLSASHKPIKGVCIQSAKASTPNEEEVKLLVAAALRFHSSDPDQNDTDAFCPPSNNYNDQPSSVDDFKQFDTKQRRRFITQLRRSIYADELKIPSGRLFIYICLKYRRRVKLKIAILHYAIALAAILTLHLDTLAWRYAYIPEILNGLDSMLSTLTIRCNQILI